MTAIAIHGRHWNKAQEYLLHQGAWYEWITSHDGSIGRYKVHCATHVIIDVWDERHASYLVLKYGAHIVDYLLESFTERGIDSMSIYFDDNEASSRDYKYVDGRRYRVLK